jgi:hypothetical protein
LELTVAIRGTILPHRRAVTLIEAVLFIAIALGIIIGGLVFYQQAVTARQTQETVRLVRSLVVEGRTMMKRAGVTEWQGPDNLANVLIKSNAVPSNYISDSGTEIQSPWGKALRVGAEDQSLVLGLPAGTIETMTLRLGDVPPKVCARLTPFNSDGNGLLGDGILYCARLTPFNSDGNGLLGDGILYLEISNNDIPYTQTSYGQKVLDLGGNAGADPQIGLTPAEAGESCAAAAAGGEVTIEAWFGWDS